MYYSVLIVGKPGACKTTSSGSILREAQQNGFRPLFDSDRIRLENRVMQDTEHGKLMHDQTIVGKHSILIDGTKPPGRKVFQVTDGILLNEEHDKMVRIAMTHKNNEGVILEYALGNDTHFQAAPDHPLLQSGESLVRRLSQFRVGEDRRVVVLEVEAGFGVRIERNGVRFDGMNPDTIDAFFRDGCELQDYKNRLPKGVTYHYIDNNPDGVDELVRKLEKFHTEVLRPVLEECREARDAEGRPASTHDRGRR